MSTTVAHPESVSGRGPSGRTIGMAVAGVVVAAALGFAIANESATEAGIQGSAQVDSADIKYQQAGATRAAAEATRRQEVLDKATTGVSQGTAGATITAADLVAHSESLAGELQALHGVAKSTSQAVPWTEFVFGASAAAALEIDQVAAIQAHAESLAGELEALRGVAVPTNQAIPWTEFVNGDAVANASEATGPGFESRTNGIR